jgi:superfamily II DNA helicase RecQ
VRDCAEEVLVRLTHSPTHSPTHSLFHSFIHCRGYSSLRPHQYDICSALLSGRDAFALMATGSGKSLAFQLPPVLLRDCVSGVGSSSSSSSSSSSMSVSVNGSVNKSAARAWSLVICPLISLAEDQVAELNAIGVPVSKVHVTYSHTHAHTHAHTHIHTYTTRHMDNKSQSHTCSVNSNINLCDDV